jgi:hypothetical protein
MGGEKIVKIVRAQRIKWWGYFNRMGEGETVRKIMEWNPMGIKCKRNPKIRGEV